MQLPVTVNLTCYRGDTWEQIFRLRETANTPLDLSDPTTVVTATARSDPNSTDPYTHSTLLSSDPQAETLYPLTVEIVDPPNGVIRLTMPTTPLGPGPLPHGNYNYDVEVATTTTTPQNPTPTPTRKTWIKGQLYVHRDVTNPPAPPNPAA